MKKKTVYLVVIGLVLLFGVYGSLVTWRPYMTEGLFKFDCCSWAITRYGSIEDKPKKKVK